MTVRLVEAIEQNVLSDVQEHFLLTVRRLVGEKLIEMKKMTMANNYSYKISNDEPDNTCDECDGSGVVDGKPCEKCGGRGHVLDETKKWYSPRKMGRVKLIPIRVRTEKGSNRPVVQRRKKFSAVKGFTIRSGKFTRMLSTEKMNRKRGARRAKIKRRAKKARIHIRFERSLRKRKALGLR